MPYYTLKAETTFSFYADNEEEALSQAELELDDVFSPDWEFEIQDETGE